MFFHMQSYLFFIYFAFSVAVSTYSGCLINLHETNVFSHLYHLDRVIFHFYSFFDENHVSKQNSPRWDAVFCGVSSGAILFAFVP